MVHRDPQSGQFVADDGAGEADPYMNHETIVSTNTWKPQNGGNYTFDDVDGRDSQQTVEIDRPDDHLIEIYGFQSHWGDPAGAGDTAKFDVFVVNDDDAPPKLRGWPTTIDQDDTLIYSTHTQTINDTTNSLATTWTDDNPAGYYPKPVLSTGKLGVLARNSPDGDGGEFALSVHYGYREFDDQQILKQLLGTQ